MTTDLPTTRTEADAVAEVAARAAIQPDHENVDLGHTGQDAVTFITPDGGQRHLLDLQPHEAQPRRARGTITVHDGRSFCRALTQRSPGPDAADYEPVLYADAEHAALVAILNDDGHDGSGWRDYRIALALRPTPEWTRWKNGQGLGDQGRFAQAIEDGEDEIVDPSPALMLEIAQTFSASVGSKFGQATRLKDGRRQLSYVENIEANAGETGNLVLPDEFLIRLAPYVGADEVDVRCRIRFTVRAAQLQIGYVLVHPEKVEADAFDVVLAEVQATSGQEAIAGPAPSPAAPIELTLRKVS